MEQVGVNKEFVHHGTTSKVVRYKWSPITDIPGIPISISKHELKIDSRYQRSISKSRVSGLRENWSYLACGSLIVARRPDDEFYVVDGGHRLEAARCRDDIDHLACLVFKAENVSDEAIAFYRANACTSKMLMFDKLRAMLVYGDQLAVDAITLLQAHGYHASKGHERFGLSCISCYLEAFSADRGLMAKILPMLAKLHDGEPIKDRLLSTILYIAKNGSADITQPRWEQRILDVGLARLADAISRAASLYTRGGAKVYAIGALQVINKGLRESARIELKDG